MKFPKNYHKYAVYSDEKEKLLLFRYGLISQKSPHLLSVIVWNKEAHHLLKVFSDKSRKFSGFFTNIWEDGEIEISLHEFEFCTKQLDLLRQILKDPLHLSLGNDYLYMTEVSGKFKKEQGRPWRKSYLIDTLDELIGIKFTKRGFEKRAMIKEEYEKEWIKDKLAHAYRESAADDLEICSEWEVANAPISE